MAEYVHHVCTRAEAREILDRLGQDRFWVYNCGCRDSRGTCARSRHDVCLGFEPWRSQEEPNARITTRAGAEELLREAEAKHLVMRPFRDKDLGHLVGFCICCDDCCHYFQEPDAEPCEKGALVERTDESACTDCGDCAQVCFFGARKMDDGRLVLEHESCYGCGLCLDACPAGCIEMVVRP